MTDPAAGPSRPSGGKSTPENPWPVRTVSQKVSEWIAKLGQVWVDGEVAQLNRRSGTTYITLRDPAANISLSLTCATSLLDDLSAPLAEGARVVIHAKPDFYLARGTFSLRASEIRQVGLGELMARVERLRKLLEAEGLFRPERKRKLPFLPHRIGLITGRDSAAEHDVVSNARLRWPGVELVVRNCTVQGRNAAAEVIEELKILDADPTVEVIIIARGGGSVEDLLPFSDETLCRVVSAARTPIVSAIGHEPDAPLLDYVADLRASTPTDAAKRVVPDVGEEAAAIRSGRERVRAAVRRLVERESQSLAAIRSRPCLADRYLIVEGRAEELVRLRATSRQTVSHLISLASADLTHTRARVLTLSPQSTLERGYAVLQRRDRGVVRDPADVSAGELLDARVAGGALSLTVTTPSPTERNPDGAAEI